MKFLISLIGDNESLSACLLGKLTARLVASLPGTNSL